MKKPTWNLTVCLPKPAEIDAKILMARLRCKSYSALVLKLIALETKFPHDDAQGSDDALERG